jgi:hypothetical protein
MIELTCNETKVVGGGDLGDSDCLFSSPSVEKELDRLCRKVLSTELDVCDTCLASSNATTAPARCNCLDFNDVASPTIVVKNLDRCWQFCCKSVTDFHAAKFGKYTANC